MTPLDSSSSILVLAETSDRPFCSPDALAELLRLEGINDLATARLEQTTPKLLEGQSLVLLGPADPAPEIAELLLEHVKTGGGLICFAPGEAFAKRLGLDPNFRGQMNGRLRIPFEGFPDVPLPIKGWAQHYAPKPSTEMSEITPLLDSAGQPAGSSAVMELRIGKGKIVVVAYDLAASVYLTRQGNPLLAGCRSTGFPRMRPSDLFEGGQDLEDAAWPVADLQCHFLRELLHRAWPDDTVLPWLWYFPNNVGTVLLLTSDDDWSKREHFEKLIAACEANDARLTFYLVQKNSVMDRAWLVELERRGFDFSVHPDLPPPTRPLWEQRLAEHVRQFETVYGRKPTPSVRNHCITWSGYLEGARIESKFGFSVDTNYFSLLPQGRYYMTGAGTPMPFVDLNGEVLPMFQLPTQFSDETTLGGQGFKWSLNLTPDQGIELVTRLLHENATRHHSMMCVNAHPVSFATYSSPLWGPVMQFAKAQGVPVWGVDHFRRFWEIRRSVRLKPIPKGETSPQVAGISKGTVGLTAMVPVTLSHSEGETRSIGGRRFLISKLM